MPQVCAGMMLCAPMASPTASIAAIEQLVLQPSGGAPDEVGGRLHLRHGVQHCPHTSKIGHVGAALFTPSEVRLERHGHRSIEGILDVVREKFLGLIAFHSGS